MAEKAEFLAGMVVGALVGIGLGMLFAPQSGEQTRQRIRDRADEMGDRIRTGAEDISGRVRETADDLTRRGRTAYEEGTRRLRQAYDRGPETMKPGETIGGLEDTEQS